MVDYRFLPRVSFFCLFFPTLAHTIRETWRTKMNLYLEIFGYIGTLLIFISMTMSSLKRLRILNAAGSVISMIYSLILPAYPIAFLNLGLILVNVYKLITENKKGEKE